MELTRRDGLAALGLLGAVGALRLDLRPDPALAQAGQQVDEIRWALPSIPNSLFIPHAWDTYIGAVMSLVQDGLLSFDDKLGLAPAAAEGWTQPDPTTYVYRLRPGVKFSDGTPLTADDVVASMSYHTKADSGSQLAAFYSSVDSIAKSGEGQVTVKLKSANVQFQYTPAHMAGFLFQAKQLAEHASDLGTPDVLPLGTGPYRIVEFAPGDHVTLEASDGYWGPKPFAKRITMQSIPDRQTRLLAMRNGDVDGTFDLSISDIDQWKALPGVNVVTAPSLGVYSITLDMSKPPLDDVHARRAIAYAVDRHGLVASLLKGNGEPATALNPPEIWSGILTPEEVRSFYASIPSYGFDLDKAKAELKQSATPNGFSLTVPAASSDPYMVNMLQSVAENLKGVGIALTIAEQDHNQWLAGYFAHESLGMQVMPYFPDFPDAANYPGLFFGSASASKDGMNGSNYKSPAVDKLLDAANQQADPKARAAALQAVFKAAAEDVPLVPVFWPYTAMAINAKYRLTGFTAFWYNIPWAERGFGPKAA